MFGQARSQRLLNARRWLAKGTPELCSAPGEPMASAAANGQPATDRLDSIIGGQESLHASIRGASSCLRCAPDYSTAPHNAGKILNEAGQAVETTVWYGESELGCEIDKRNNEEPFSCSKEPFKVADLLWQAARTCGCKNPNCPNLFVKERGAVGNEKQQKQSQDAGSLAATTPDERKATYISGVEIVPASAILATLINCRLKELGLSAVDPESYKENQDYSAIFKESVEFVAKLCVSSNSGVLNELGHAVHKGKTVKVNFEDIVTCHSHKCIKRALGNIMRSVGVAEACICDETLSISGGLTETCLLYTSPSPRDRQKSRMPSSA